MRTPSLRGLLIPILALGAGCEDFLDPDLSDGEGEFDDLGHLGEEGAFDDPEVDPVDVGGLEPVEPLESQTLQIGSVSEPSVWEELDPRLAHVRVGRDGSASIWLDGEEVLGSAWVDGDQIVLYGLTTWDFALDEVDGPVEAELIGIAAPAAP